MAVSLRVPENVKRRIAKLAEEQETPPHAFMLKAIRDRLDAEEARAAFHAEAILSTILAFPAARIR